MTPIALVPMIAAAALAPLAAATAASLLRGRRIGPVSKLLAPGRGACMCCRTSWAVVEAHETPYRLPASSVRGACFPLCEGCWTELANPQARLPFYRRLYARWGIAEPERWASIERGVVAEAAAA